MTNSSLITVFNGSISNQTVQLANARDLHSFLESNQDFSNWISNRISEYGFIQDEDYITLEIKTRGRPRKEYHITLDMGKELAMVERNEKGRQIRKYFIECERKMKEILQNNQQIAPLASPAAEEETMHIIVNLFHCLNEAYELGRKLCDEHPHLARELNKQVGGHYLHNLHHPARNALDKAKRYIQAESERIMFIKGMIALLETPKPKAVSQF